ncbi:MAG: hypothetical protein Q7R94_02635, partial [bacterium]|nr:hypothetical protein [bacterium]
LDALGIDALLFKTNGEVIPLQAKRSQIRVRGHYIFKYKNEETQEKKIFRLHEFVIAIEIPHCKDEEEDVVAEELSYDLEKIVADMEKNPSLSPRQRFEQKLFPYHNYK